VFYSDINQNEMSCQSCKKKKVVKQLDPIIQEDVWVPSMADIKLAYAEFNSLTGVREDKKEFVSKVYKFLFGEELVYNCRGCGNSQSRKFHNYIKTL
jgi:hypothetical protein